MTSNVKMVFRGEVLDGFQADDVKRRLAQAFRLDDDRLAQLFSGARMVLKRSLEPAIARNYADKLARLGARVDLERSDTPPTIGFTPLPELPEVPESQMRPPPPWVAPPAPARPAPVVRIPAPPPIPASTPVVQRVTVLEVACPICGERQTNRRLCRNCANDMTMVAAASAVGFSFEGRMGRLKFATSNVALMALLYLPLIMALQEPTPGLLSVLAAAAAALAFFGMRLAVLRCHDCNQSGWWSLLLWLPAVNLIVAAVLVCAAGTEGSNAYGAQPPPSRWWGFAAAALCAVLLVTLTFSQVMQIIE